MLKELGMSTWKWLARPFGKVFSIKFRQIYNGFLSGAQASKFRNLLCCSKEPVVTITTQPVIPVYFSRGYWNYSQAYDTDRQNENELSSLCKAIIRYNDHKAGDQHGLFW